MKYLIHIALFLICFSPRIAYAQDPSLTTSSLQLISKYSNPATSPDDCYEILQSLSTRNDPNASRFFQNLMATPPGKINPHYVPKGNFAVVPADGPTGRYLAEHEHAWKFFSLRADFPDSTTLFSTIKKYPCVIPFAAPYLIAKRDRFTPEMCAQLNKLDLKRDGPFFDAWARYLKLKILKRPADEVQNDSMAIREAFLQSLEPAWNPEAERTNNFYTLIEAVSDLAMNDNVIAMESMFMMMPRMDGAAGETMSFEMEKIASHDFDFFITHAHKIMKQDKIEDMLEGIWACDLDADKFKQKYAAKLRDPKYPYHHDITLIANGPPEIH